MHAFPAIASQNIIIFLLKSQEENMHFNYVITAKLYVLRCVSFVVLKNESVILKSMPCGYSALIRNSVSTKNHSWHKSIAAE